MTENQIPPQPPYQPDYIVQPAPAAEKPKRKFAIVAIIVGALLAGGAVGAAAKPPVEKIVEVEKTVTEFKTPAACAEGYSLAEDIMISSSTTIGYITDAMGSLTAMQKLPAKIDTETTKLERLGPKYRAARDACLEEGK